MAAQNPEFVTAKRARVAGLTRRNASPETIEATRADLNQAVAIRAVDDPVQLARGAAIVRAALVRKLITLTDLTLGAGDEG